ncbi:hypothetical protein [Caldovatus aquaticus]|uniref:Uncharacterized protein n=1 Tax=Caldovatus aquaticus TaxID=2865671 RepID=A0ABS7EY94_9PROT|nr:hypothetical protein [Caldovatus aquaticus]MBW8268320.1 hypothetical protein [Caldovatus aquaticus]
MNRFPDDPARAAENLRRTMIAAREMMRRADPEQIKAALPRLRALLAELDGASAIMLLIHHLAALSIAVAAEADGDEDRRFVTLNLPTILLGQVINNAWATLRQDAAEAAADPIGEPAGHA